MKGDIPIQVGTYGVDDTSWFDVRQCDGGVMLSLCDADLDIRYTVIIDGKKIILKEIEKVMPETIAEAEQG